MRFYFNHTSGHSDASQPLEARFERLMRNYWLLLRRKELFVEPGIITNASPGDIIICHYTLKILIGKVTDKELKRMVYSWFTRYPVDAQQEYEFTSVYHEYEELDYTYHVAEEDVTHLLVPSRLGWPVLSMPMDDVWLPHEVVAECSNPEGCPIRVNSFHGDNYSNFTGITRWLIEQKYSGRSNPDQRDRNENKWTDLLKNILGRHDVELSAQAEDRFKRFSDTDKHFVVDMIQRAFQQQRLFPPIADNDLVKSCHGDGNERTYEIRHNQGIRIYFQTHSDRLIIGGIHTKAEGEGVEQSADIDRATIQCQQIIKESMQTTNCQKYGQR